MNTSILSEKFQTALVYATRLHRNQIRKISGVPYIAHLLSVAALVLEAGGTEAEVIAHFKASKRRSPDFCMIV